MFISVLIINIIILQQYTIHYITVPPGDTYYTVLHHFTWNIPDALNIYSGSFPKVVPILVTRLCWNRRFITNDAKWTRFFSVFELSSVFLSVCVCVTFLIPFYKTANYGQISNIKVSMKVSLQNTSIYHFKIFKNQKLN